MEITKEAIKRQYAKNAAQLAQMAEHPKCKNGGKYNGYTRTELLERAAKFRKLAGE